MGFSDIFSSLRILGIRVDDVDYSLVLKAVEQAVSAGVPRQIVTLNPEMLMQARNDRELRDAIENAYLVTPDGAGLLLAARLQGNALSGRVTGVDLVPPLCCLAAQRGYRTFFLGAAPGVAEEAAKRLFASRPGSIEKVRCYPGSPAPEEEEEIVRLVHSHSPDLLLVAYGVPAEEKWIARNLEALGVPVAIGVGGAFDFISGRVPRAPDFMRRAGVEWLYRLYKQPWRWRRMMVLPRFLAAIFAEAIATRIRSLR